MQVRRQWKLIIIFLFGIYTPIRAFSQNPIAEGTNSLGLHDTTVWAVATNPANISTLSNPAAGIGACNNHLIPGLNRYYATAAFRARNTLVAIDMQYHGYSVWKETSGGMAISHRLGKSVSLSGKLGYLYVAHGEESPPNIFFLPQLYATVAVNEFSNFHVQISPAIWSYHDKLPSRYHALTFGSSNKFSPEFSAFADVALPLSSKLRVSAGCQYTIHPCCNVRFGVATDEYPLGAGISAGKNAVWFDISCRYHRYMGIGLACGIRFNM